MRAGRGFGRPFRLEGYWRSRSLVEAADSSGLADSVLVSTLNRLVLTFGATAVGYQLAKTFHLEGVQHSSQYLYGATALLAIGLFGSTSGIFIEAFRSNIRLILTAVTLGVFLKAALIAGCMYLIYRDPAYFVLGVAVAQIDPLSVSAMQRNSRLSKGGNAILLAWSSFDDPVTMLFTIYLSAFALSRMGSGIGLPSDSILAGGLSSFGESLLVNAAFAGFALALWVGIVAANRAILRSSASRRRMRAVARAPLVPALNILAIVLLIVLAVVAVMYFLMLGLAIVGLFFRPSLGTVLGWLTRVAFVSAAVCLGMVLVSGFHLVPGLALGGVAFIAQVLVGGLITRSLPKSDRGYLACGQQNGITAIILALLLEPSFPEAAGIVAPAILAANLLHGVCTAAWGRVVDRNLSPERADDPSPEPADRCNPLQSARHPVPPSVPVPQPVSVPPR
jgi:NhaP-type Na+/H+ or K+/H+ antiporter